MKDPLNGRDVETIPREDLLDIKDKVDEQSRALKAEVRKAKARVITHGEYSDPEWFSRVQNDISQLSGVSQKIQRHLARGSWHKAFHTQFFLACKKYLEAAGKEGLFQALCEEAKKNMRPTKRGERVNRFKG